MEDPFIQALQSILPLISLWKIPKFYGLGQKKCKLFLGGSVTWLSLNTAASWQFLTGCWNLCGVGWAQKVRLEGHTETPSRGWELMLLVHCKLCWGALALPQELWASSQEHIPPVRTFLDGAKAQRDRSKASHGARVRILRAGFILCARELWGMAVTKMEGTRLHCSVSSVTVLFCRSP